MAKVYEPQIDPEEFIRTFRDDPSGLSSLKRKSASKPQQSTDPVPASEGDNTSPEKAADPTSKNPERERLFMERFVRNMRYMWPEDKFQVTEIDPQFIWKIRKILFHKKKGKVCSIKAYINNVLAAHFDEFADIINPML